MAFSPLSSPPLCTPPPLSAGLNLIMANIITCGFARVRVREIVRKHTKKGCSLAVNKHDDIVHEYNSMFENYPKMQACGESRYLTKKFRELNASFSRRWNPRSNLTIYMDTFSEENWTKLPQTQKQQHSLQLCQACPFNFSDIDCAFPVRSPAAKRKLEDSQLVNVEVSVPDLTTPPTKVAKKLGRDIIAQLNPACQRITKMPLSRVLDLTPGSGVTQRKSHTEKKRERRKRMRDIKQSIESEFKQRDSSLLLQNRLSYRKYNKIRLVESFESTEAAIHRTSKKTATSTKSHGCSESKLPFDSRKLLDEASQWSEEEEVNWTKLAERYGVTSGNRGQVVKEYLGKMGIPVAQKQQRQFTRRAKLKLPGGEISHPCHLSVSAQKVLLQGKIDKGEILLGEILPPMQFIKFSVDSATRSIVETTISVHGRKVPLYDVRSKMLRYHEKLGLLRSTDMVQISTYTSDELNDAIRTRKISVSEQDSDDVKRQLLLQCSKQRHLKIWHDHGKLAGHGHALVLVGGIYDPAVYYTPQELAAKSITIDVETVVERPEIHVIARCGSSDAEQFTLNEFRTDCLSHLSQPIYTTSGMAISDMARFFHGDGPAQQFEAGQSRGGNYPCVGCDAHVNRFDDLCYCYRRPFITLQERQRFMLKGKAWQTRVAKPLDRLTKAQLEAELNAHRTRPVLTQTKKEMQEEFDTLRKGITTFPALLTSDPQSDVAAMNIGRYEVSPSEPLHDFKGHMSNVIGEIKKQVTGNIKSEVEKVTTAILGKDTLRCVDYRKAAILLSNALRQTNADSAMCQLLNTAVEICQLMYAREEVRSPKAVLRMHNVTFVHAMLCTQLFHEPRSITKRKMFGRYYHAISTHAAPVYRLISLRSLNAEMQERLFNLCNDNKVHV